VRISAAAIRIADGTVHTGKSHAEIILSLAKGCCKFSNLTQGFVTDTGEFLTRSEAAKIAYEAGQISEPAETVLSEDFNHWRGEEKP